jgi:hypothetical protein
MAVHSVPVRGSVLQSPCHIIQAVAVDVGKSRWYIALAINRDVWSQQTIKHQDTSKLEKNVYTLATSRWFTMNNISLVCYARLRHRKSAMI